MSLNQFKNKHVVVVGLGLLGGGVATTNWLLDHGARVTVTDLKNRDQLLPSVKKIEAHMKRVARDGAAYEKMKASLSWELGGHAEQLMDRADIVVVNPDVSIRHALIVRALKRGVPVYNEGTLFFDAWSKPIIGITGTRGKTTTATWTHHLMGTSVLTGNSIVKPFCAALDERSRATHAVAELSSFVLELFPYASSAPRVAVITNIYRDHLNRHRTMEEYAAAKANIFSHQTAHDFLIVNADNEWTQWLLRHEPASAVYQVSMSPLPVGTMGAWYEDGAIVHRTKKGPSVVLALPGFLEQWGEHNMRNLLCASLAAHLAGTSWEAIQQKIPTLPQVQYRQELVYRDAQVTIVNDTTATSPEGGIAAVRRWGGPNCILICGGTDRDLVYHEWAREVRAHIRRTNMIFLSGSATRKMRASLGAYARGVRAYSNLESALHAAQKRACTYVHAVILFSPSAKSFELFANEFDRGQQFNALVGQFT